MEKIYYAYKYRVYPDEQQQESIDHQYDLLRQMWNTLLERCITFYEESGKKPGRFALQRFVTEFKKDNPQFAEVYSQCYTDLNIRLDRSWAAFFRQIKAGEKAGPPHFKAYGTYSSMCRQTQTKRDFFIKPDSIQFSQALGELKARPLQISHNPIPDSADLKTLNIRKENERYYGTFTVQIPKPEPRKFKSKKTVTITFHPDDDDIYLTDSLPGFKSKFRKVLKPRFYLKAEEKISEVQRAWAYEEKQIKKKMVKASEESKIRYQEELQTKKQEFKKELNDLYFRLKTKRANWVHKQVNFYTEGNHFSHIIIEVQKFSKKITNNKEHNKILLDSRGYFFTTIMKQQAQRIGFELTIQEPKK